LLSQRHATAKLVACLLILVGHLENRRERQQFWQRSAAVRKYSEHRRPEMQRAVGLRGAQQSVRAGNPELDSILSSTVKATVVSTSHRSVPQTVAPVYKAAMPSDLFSVEKSCIACG
jgi:hypothetical protein